MKLMLTVIALIMLFPPEPIDPPIIIPGEHRLYFPVVYNQQYPAQGEAAVEGVLFDSETGEPLSERIVWLAEVWKVGDSLVWILDSARSPSYCSDNSFSFARVKAWQYVLVVGNPWAGDFDVVQEILYVKPYSTLVLGEVYAHTERASCRLEGSGAVSGVIGE